MPFIRDCAHFCYILYNSVFLNNYVLVSRRQQFTFFLNKLLSLLIIFFLITIINRIYHCCTFFFKRSRNVLVHVNFLISISCILHNQLVKLFFFIQSNFWHDLWGSFCMSLKVTFTCTIHSFCLSMVVLWMRICLKV